MTQQIVIVDDDELHLKLLGSIAREIDNVAIHTFSSSIDALVWIDGKDIDCFIFDYNMPAPDGLQMIELVRAMEPFARVPIVMVTGAHERDVRYLALDAGANDFVQKPVDYREMVARLTTLLTLHDARKRLALQVDSLGGSLREAEERSRQHAERLEAMWRLVNNRSLGDVEMWLAMLDQAAEAIRPGQAFRGMLARIEGADLIVEAIADTPEPGSLPDDGRGQIGQVVPLAETIFADIIAAGGGSRSWSDIQGSDAASARIRAGEWRALIMTTFSAGESIYALTFISREVAKSAFGPQDQTYVQILASFFANHLHQRWQSERIQYQQTHDGLTGLLNRAQFRSQARSAAVTADRYALILVDINAFREINESYGNMIGDTLLVEVAAALRGRALQEELVGRVGGNTFGIYVPAPTSAEHLMSRTRDLASVFGRAFSTGDREGRGSIGLTACLGIAAAPQDGLTIDAILSHADAALSAAKERGHGAIVVYETGMEGEAQRRATLRSQLTEAAAGDQFLLHYQPHIDIETGNVTGCEALIRWQHPERGLLLPGQFIPFAEQTGIITIIDAWVMRNAFAATKELAEIEAGFRLYFNLSGRQAGDQAMIRGFCEAARQGVNLANLGVEITETDAMRDVESTRRVCRALRRLGVHIAIDDFGTGYSSLSSLKRLPVDIVKIDRSFISGITTDPHDETIAETIISIADRFGFETLAEGVERPEEIEWLRRHGCRLVQGFAICRPVPLAELKSWLVARREKLPAR